MLRLDVHTWQFYSFFPHFFFLTICKSLFSVTQGPYNAVLVSVDDLPDVKKTKCDWKFQLRRINRTDQIFTGYFKPKERIGPVTVNNVMFSIESRFEWLLLKIVFRHI